MTALSTQIGCFNDFRLLLVDNLEFFQYPVNDLMNRYGMEYMEDAVSILNWLEIFATRHGDSLEKVLAGYADYVRRAAIEYRDFHKNSLYQHTPQQQLEQILSDPVFQLHYLYTLTLSTPLNRSRYELFKNYRSVAAPHLRRGGRALEIGCGNYLDAKFASNYTQVDAYELNFYSACWQEILDLQERIRLRFEWYDFGPEQIYDFVTMIEILEHLSEPEEYLRGAHRVLKNGGHAYLTFAVRMPQIDHLISVQFQSMNAESLSAETILHLLPSFARSAPTALLKTMNDGNSPMIHVMPLFTAAWHNNATSSPPTILSAHSMSPTT